MNILKLIRLQYLDYSLVLQIFLPWVQLSLENRYFISYALSTKHAELYLMLARLLRAVYTERLRQNFCQHRFIDVRCIHPCRFIDIMVNFDAKADASLQCERPLIKHSKQNIKHKMSFTSTLAICMKQTRLNTYIILKKDWTRVFTVL